MIGSQVAQHEALLVLQPLLAGRNTRTVLMREHALTGRRIDPNA
jgi:hypothetical protein